MKAKRRHAFLRLKSAKLSPAAQLGNLRLVPHKGKPTLR